MGCVPASSQSICSSVLSLFQEIATWRDGTLRPRVLCRYIHHHIGSMEACVDYVKRVRPQANGATWGYKNYRCYAESPRWLAARVHGVCARWPVSVRECPSQFCTA